MTRGQNSKAEQQRRGRATRRARRTLRAHPLFVPILAIWGALLGGLVTFVLPAGAVLAAAANIGLGAFDELSRFVLIGLAALLTGGMMLLLGMALASKARAHKDTPSLAAMAVRHVRTIDPASELGSPSFDAPVETMPFSITDPRPELEVAPEAAPEAEPAPAPVALAVVETAAPEAAVPQALDLAAFAALPGRNAVWVEEPVAAVEPSVAEAEPAPAPAPEPETLVRRTAPRPVSPSAIERLRAVPTSELSLVQMVERFAAALHEHQSAPNGTAGLAARDAALAEALRALAALSRDSEAQTQSEPVRAALGRLQELRGAA